MAQPPPDVDGDDCLPEYRHLFCPDLLRDQVAFITGGGSGIGFRIAEVFMRHGCHTVIASRSLPRVSMAAKKLVAATGQRCLPLSLDVRDPPAITAAVDEALREFGRIDILVNGAAGNFLCPASALSFNAFKTVLDIDTAGTFNVSRVLYEKFFRDHGGVIINITATLGLRGQVLQVHAGAAKAAVDTMTRHLAVEWGHQNIRVNSLAPGPISGTEGFRRLVSPQGSTVLRSTGIPLQRIGNKTEIAHGALYLASPAASYVTGAVLVADGGAWLTSSNNTGMVPPPSAPASAEQNREPTVQKFHPTEESDVNQIMGNLGLKKEARITCQHHRPPQSVVVTGGEMAAGRSFGYEPQGPHFPQERLPPPLCAGPRECLGFLGECCVPSAAGERAAEDRPRLRAVFEALDGDGDGLVRVEDFEQFATAYGAEQVSAAPPSPRVLLRPRPGATLLALRAVCSQGSVPQLLLG
ncbi:peroxisomal 2,4-dienoyl-CoA reductase [(3E)-enoyl-CoA-producing] [Orycteropus afer afer]|uniref:Peroxisomal 2,4-dienoyl-CoA reductase [(3E)-enoyl-CoA-producing] n=1 Tax=Orycteropus afer afer TaxID=1230840 RepID=A0A8B7B665_ORYAF|nr:peroxisomal 2,4-dienoyl-CoA reductase [(3E)-enoyl-CoA-producing] [Orycteropus afer afer]